MSADVDDGVRAPSLVSRRKDIQWGKPCIRGTRIPVRAIKNFHGSGFSVEEIREEFPTLSVEQVEAAIAYGSRRSIPATQVGE